MYDVNSNGTLQGGLNSLKVVDESGFKACFTVLYYLRT